MRLVVDIETIARYFPSGCCYSRCFSAEEVVVKGTEAIKEEGVV
jgi:hypothetical protein